MSERAADKVTAVILAGGKGTRLWPYTAVLPKPLMPLGEMPVLELVLRQLAAQGTRKVLLAVNHLHHLVESFFGRGEWLGLEIDYSLEDEPLGTAAPLAPVLDQLADNFLILNGDLFTNFDFAQLMRDHTDRRADLTVAAHRRAFQVDFGVLNLAESDRVQSIVEKPTIDHWVAMGIYAARRDALRPLLNVGTRADMPTVIDGLIKNTGAVFAHRQDCIWLDIGRPDDYSAAQSMFASNRNAFLAE